MLSVAGEGRRGLAETNTAARPGAGDRAAKHYVSTDVDDIHSASYTYAGRCFRETLKCPKLGSRFHLKLYHCR
ncbi:hypothetical protein IMZ48_02170 [Candidatus Bathyarchaeota archaeon]|nr:hypothetical protein [Candidatus Bathyarchaeota archaeon]